MTSPTNATSRGERRALLVVDVQVDFCEGGSLAVDGGAAAAIGISDLAVKGDYDVVIATRDAHIDPGGHFAAEDEEPDYRETWPEHCVVGTAGFEFHPDLAIDHAIEIHKGNHTAAYSGFEGHNARDREEPLTNALRRLGITDVDVAGIAGDFCVAATARDALAGGFGVRLVDDLTPAVSAEGKAAAFAELSDSGAEIVTSASVRRGPVAPEERRR